MARSKEQKKGAWYIAALKGIGWTIMVIGAVLLRIVQWLLSLIGRLIPRKLWRPLIWFGLLLLAYRYIYPKRHPFVDAQPYLARIPRNLPQARAHASASWRWVKGNLTLLGSVGSAIGFFVAAKRLRDKEKKDLRKTFDKLTPDLTVHFSLSEDDGTVCTILNLGGGNAMLVEFRLYTFHEITQKDRDNHFGIRSRELVILKEDRDRLWRVHTTRYYSYIPPNGRQPKTVPLGIVPAEESHEIRVEIEYIDALDRRHFQYAHGGQSQDHTHVNVGKWTRSVTWRGDRESAIPAWMAYIASHIARVVWQFDHVTEPMIEYELKAKTEKVDRWLAKHGVGAQQMDTED